MRSKILSLLLSLVILVIFTTFSYAQETNLEEGQDDIEVSTVERLIPPPSPEPGFLGQNHSYSLVFRGNGEAIVSARIIFTNKTDSLLSEMTLRVPQVKPENISVYQQIREKRCIRYDTRVRTLCLEYQDPDYYTYWSESKYQKAEYEYEGDTLIITLPQPVSVDKQGSFFIYYRAFGYAEKNIFGAYHYEFESLEVNDDIRDLQVGISTDSDLVLKGVKGEVDYRFEEPQLASLEKAGAPIANTSVDSFYQQIGYGQIIKSASNLAALESYAVTGAYAKNNLSLYAKELLIGLTVMLLLVVIIILVIKYVFSKLKTTEEEKPKEGKVSETGIMLATSAAVSFVSSLLIAGYTALIIILGTSLTSVVGYRYTTIVVLFLVIISFAVYSLLIFVPAIYLGIKKGLGWGVASIIATVIWLIVLLAITIFVLFFTNTRINDSPVYPGVEVFKINN